MIDKCYLLECCCIQRDLIFKFQFKEDGCLKLVPYIRNGYWFRRHKMGLDQIKISFDQIKKIIEFIELKKDRFSKNKKTSELLLSKKSSKRKLTLAIGYDDPSFSIQVRDYGISRTKVLYSIIFQEDQAIDLIKFLRDGIDG